MWLIFLVSLLTWYNNLCTPKSSSLLSFLKKDTVTDAKVEYIASVGSLI